MFSSTANAFRIAHPTDVTTTLLNEIDYFQAPTGGIGGVGRDSRGAASLTKLTAAEIALIKKNWRTSAVNDEAFKVAGEAARFLTWTGTPPGGTTKGSAYEAVIVHGTYVYFVFWFASADTAAAELTVFKEMLSTFEFA